MKTPIKFKYDGQEADVIAFIPMTHDSWKVYLSKEVYINVMDTIKDNWNFYSDGTAVGFEENAVMLIFEEDSKSVENLMDTKDYWKIGAKVFSIRYGKGIIAKINYNHIYSICVTHKGINEYTYTKSGKHFTSSPFQTLFYEDAVTFDEQGRPVKFNYDYVPPHLNKPTFNYSKHKEMWNWLANNPDKTKSDWFEKTGYEFTFPSKCFACAASNSSINTIRHCPLMDGWCDGTSRNCLQGLFATWDVPSTLQVKSVLAKAIADLPLSEHKDLYNII